MKTILRTEIVEMLDNAYRKLHLSYTYLNIATIGCDEKHERASKLRKKTEALNEAEKWLANAHNAMGKRYDAEFDIIEHRIAEIDTLADMMIEKAKDKTIDKEDLWQNSSFIEFVKNEAKDEIYKLIRMIRNGAIIE